MNIKAALPIERSYIPTVGNNEANSVDKSNSSLQDQLTSIRTLNIKDGDIATESRNAKQALNEEDLSMITRELNKFFQYLNADLRFEVHDGTQRMMVKLVDTKTDEVLREFPPEELLDKIANIQEYIGILLDKKA